MCGLVGMAGNINNHSHSKMARDLLVIDSLRGMDSTGLALVMLGPESKVEVAKEIGGPDNLFMSKDNVLTSARGDLVKHTKCMIGHNRAATAGLVNVKNAHPFVCGHITGAHNGTLTDWSDLEDYKKNDSDSLSLFTHISKHGIDDTWKSFRGAAAITYWDAKEETINLIRNDERTLYMCYDKTGKVLFWASESWMISIAATRNKVELAEVKDEDGYMRWDIRALEPNHLYTFDVTSTDVVKREVRELEKKPIPAYTPIGQNNITAQMIGRIGAGGKPTPDKKLIAAMPAYAKINPNWSLGTEKAPKEIRGATIKLSYSLQNVGPDKEYYIVGFIDNSNGAWGDRITIYPNTYGEFLDWEHELYSGTMAKRFTLKARPRIFLNGMKVFKEYRIAGNHVVEIKQKPSASNVTRIYPGPDGTMLTEEEFENTLRNVSKDCSCSGCGNPIDNREAGNLFWNGSKSVFCVTCQEDPYMMEFFNVMAKGA